MATRAIRRSRSHDVVSDSFVQLQAKVPSHVREEWKQAALENELTLSRFFEAFVDEARRREQPLGEFLRQALRQEDPGADKRRARS